VVTTDKLYETHRLLDWVPQYCYW